MPITNPLSSISGRETELQTPGNERYSSVGSAAENEDAVPRTPAGVVDEHGNIIDKAGNTIGEVSHISSNAQKLVGSTVTAGGDVVAESGHVLGRVTLNSEYTTQATEGDSSNNGGGYNLMGKAKSAYNTIGKVGGSANNAVKGLSGLQKSISGGNQRSASSDTTQRNPKEARDGFNTDHPINAEDDSPIQMENEDTTRSNGELDAGNQSPEPACKRRKGENGSPITDEESVDGDMAANNEQKEDDDKQRAEEPLVTKSPMPIDDEEESAHKGGKEDSGEQANNDEPMPDGSFMAGEGDDAMLQNSNNASESEEKTHEERPQKPEGEESMSDVDDETSIDYSILKGTRVNKAGNLVNADGNIIGRLAEDSDIKKLVGKTADEEGNIWNDSGKIIGKAEPVPESEREDNKDFAPFENFPGAMVEADGRVTSDGKQVGEVVEGDPKRLKGSKVDEDGDILDRRGNCVGKAKAWDEPEPQDELMENDPDRSLLGGKRVNKAGNVVDSNGTIFGRVCEGNIKSLVGRMCDKDGNIMSESGDKIGKAELVPESEREGFKEGPFAELDGCTVTKDGKVTTSSGYVVGRLTSGDAKTLYGRSVDEDGDVVDKAGNSLGKAERWEEPEVEKERGAMAGRKVNREGNVVDEDGNIMGKLTSGELAICSGKQVDDDGDVVNAKGNTIGHVSLLDDIPPEPTESAEDKETREKADEDKKLAGQLAGSIEGSLEKIRPILKMITDKVDKAERTPKEDLDEDQLVKEVKPLIEEGGKILTEANGVIRGMDPDGRIQRNAKHKSKTNDASAEEHHLAEVLQELTGNVTETIDNAKRKISDMPHAKKELNPLWGLLSEPLFQILAAVGLLLNGVLGLVGRLLSGLGLGGLVDNLLGGLGVDKLLGGLGLGDAVGSLTGKKKGDSK